MGHLKVPGATLYYETSGSGPVLIMIAGGTDDTRDFDGVTPLLAADFTVVRYDCRGLSRSRCDEPQAEIPVSTHAADTYELLCAVGGGPALVFGTSSGAHIALELTAGHPEAVRGVVAHEPPTVRLLPPADPRLALVPEVLRIRGRDGVGPAMSSFVAGAGLLAARHPAGTPESPESAAAAGSRMSRIADNSAFFLDRIIGPATDYLPDLTLLRAGGPQVVVGVGEASKGQLAYDTALALAGGSGAQTAEFPGGHAGFVSHPRAFARRLRDVLRSVAVPHDCDWPTLGVRTGATVWLTGLPSSGKSTVATGLAELLLARGRRVEMLDGDELRRTLCKDLGFSRADREENVRRIGEVALTLASEGALVLVPVIAPYASSRAAVRRRHVTAGLPFVEVYIDAPVAVCSERDVKGLYARQRAGLLHGLTGVDDPYESPVEPELRLDTSLESSAESIARVERYINEH